MAGIFLLFLFWLLLLGYFFGGKGGLIAVGLLIFMTYCCISAAGAAGL